jgi:hypothetical protein
MSRRPDGITVDINVCENPKPVREMRRIYDTVSETLGFRELRQFSGADVVQLKLMLHALGYFRPDAGALDLSAEGVDVYGPEAIDAVMRFRADQGWANAVAGLVDGRTIARLWERLEDAGQAETVRRRILEIARVTR